MDPPTCDLAQKHISKLLKRCRSFVQSVKKSFILMNCVSNLKTHLKINRSFHLDCKSRWNSSCHSVEGMLLCKKIINKINSEKCGIGPNKKQTADLSLIELDQDDRKMLELIEFVLKPIVNATELVSGSRYPIIDNDDDYAVGGDSKTLYYVKSLLLRQFQIYFFDNYSQLKIMKKLHSYFDRFGFRCLTRREQGQCERIIVELNEEVVDEINTIDQPQSRSSSGRKVHSSKPSLMASFISSVSKIFVVVSSSVSTLNKKKLMEEIFVYKSLAQ
ncbi:unnamed protein product [Adineta ricciae]|uniref:Uncharacterized protein n=1 Tax=Adineta ricciae TaxID=249248 RepID=A0A815RIT6_ADIRI|nr:unnamed protein product [Adineta ricciae]